MSAEPVYRAEIRATERGWFWRVEEDVRNGRAYSGDAESYSRAAREAAWVLMALGDVVQTPQGRREDR